MCGFAVTNAVLLFVALPETKGRPLITLEEYFGDSKFQITEEASVNEHPSEDSEKMLKD
jgi:hypothetical protein